MQADTLEHQRTLRSLAMAIERICSQNSDLRASSPTVFDAVSVPAMSVHCYLVRMRRYTKFDFSCFLVAVTYLDRLCRQGSAFCPTMHNIHRLLVTALLVASKATDGALQRPALSARRPAVAHEEKKWRVPHREGCGRLQPARRAWWTPPGSPLLRSLANVPSAADIFHANLFMAQCGGISVCERNKLELEMCRRLNWALMPSPTQLHRLRGALDDEATGYWDAWRNTPKVAATCDDIMMAPCKGHTPEGGKRMPHAKSFQDQLGRILFGAGSTHEPAPSKTEAHGDARSSAAEQPRLSGVEVKPAPPSPGSPRSVFRRIFSEQVFSFGQ